MKINKKNKKAIGFFSLIGPFVLILFTLVMLTLVSPAKDSKEEVLFGENLKNLDIINNKIPAQEFYIKESVSKIIEKNKQDYTLNLGFDDPQRDNNPSNNNEILVGCRYDNLEIWYNEKNEEENKIIKSNLNGSDEEIEKQHEGMLFSNCKLEFEEEFETQIKNKIETELNEQIKKDLESLEITNIEINTDFEKTNNNLEVLTTYKASNQISDVVLKTKTTANIEIGMYPQLLLTLNEIIVDVQENMKKEATSCFEEKENSEKSCVIKGFKQLIQNKNPAVYNYYDFNIEMILEDELKPSDEKPQTNQIVATQLIKNEKIEYYLLKINVINKKTKKKELNFGLVLKDNIPHNIITFNIENSVGLDNTILLNINFPKEEIKKEISSYIVLYSNQNFFNEATYPQYSKLKQMLENNQIPKEFIKTEFMDKDQNAYAYSDPNEEASLNLNLILVPKNDINTHKDEKGNYKQVELYQIFDKTNYRLFKSNEEIFVFVFATDNNFNYYVEDEKLKEKTQNIITKSVYGPKPLEQTNVVITGSKLNYQNSIFAEIKDYNDNSFNHYDLYLTPNANTDISTCSQDVTCHSFEGKITLQNPKTNFTITSDTNIPQNTIKILPELFNPQLNLENEKTYFLHIIPKDIEEKGILSTIRKSTAITEQVTSNSLKYFQIEKTSGGEVFIPLATQVTIKDLKVPDPITSISVTPTITLNNNNYILHWTQIEKDVTKVRIEYLITYNDNGVISENKNIKEVGLDGIIMPAQPNIVKLDITKIIPLDNTFTDNPAATQTHTASYP